MRDWWDGIKFFGSAIGMILVMFLGLVSLVNRVVLPYEIAEIERLRVEWGRVPEGQREFMWPVVVECNRKLAARRIFVQTSFFGFAESSKWLSVDFIDTEEKQ